MKKRTIIFIICYIAYTSIYIARLNLSMASPSLIDSAVIDKAQVGFLGSVFSVIYAVGRLLNGYISDTKPPHFMIAAGLIICGISNIIFGFFPPFVGILILWGFNAFAQSMLWSSVLRIISSIYPEEAAKKKTSLMVTSVATGNILGILVNTFFINKFGTQFSFVIPGAFTLVMSLFVFLSTHKIEYIKLPPSKQGSAMTLIKNKEIQTAVLPSMFHGVMKDNISLWMAVFFVDKYGVNLSKSAYFVLFIPIVGLVGRLAYPLCYNRCGDNEHKVSMFAFMLCTLLSIVLCFDSTPIVAAISLSCIYAAVSLVNTSMLSIFPIHFMNTGNIASVSGIMDFATYLGAGISAFIYGFTVKYTGYTSMFISWAVLSAISIFFISKLSHK